MKVTREASQARKHIRNRAAERKERVAYRRAAKRWERQQLRLGNWDIQRKPYTERDVT